MRKGFTLIELMIVIAIIAIIAAIAIPNLLESKLTANESKASASLRGGVFPGQTTFATSGHNDIDADNVGEHGHLGHLAGVRETWGRDAAANTNNTAEGVITLLDSIYESDDVARITSSSTDEIGGYIFASYLDSDSSDVPTNAAEELQINNAEKFYAVVAVPSLYNDTGRRAFIITDKGRVLTAPGSDAYETDTDNVFVSTAAIQGPYSSIDSAVMRDNRNTNWESQQ